MSSDRRTGPVIGRPLEIVDATLGTLWETPFACILRHALGACRYIENDPVHPHALRRLRIRRIWIVNNKGETLGPCWHALPSERRRHVRALAGILRRHGSAWLEGWRGEGQSQGSFHCERSGTESQHQGNNKLRGTRSDTRQVLAQPNSPAKQTQES